MSNKLERARDIIQNIRDNIGVLTVLPELARSLEQLPEALDSLQEEADVKSTFASYREAMDTRLAHVEEELKQQKDQLFLTDEKYKHLVDDVKSVLADLKEYLRIHT